jgi:hypothetical protein
MVMSNQDSSGDQDPIKEARGYLKKAELTMEAFATSASMLGEFGLSFTSDPEKTDVATASTVMLSMKSLTNSNDAISGLTFGLMLLVRKMQREAK